MPSFASPSARPQQGGKYPRGDEQCHRKGRQSAAGDRRQQQAQRERDARRHKKTTCGQWCRASVLGPPHLGQQLPKHLTAPR